MRFLFLISVVGIAGFWGGWSLHSSLAKPAGAGHYTIAGQSPQNTGFIPTVPAPEIPVKQKQPLREVRHSEIKPPEKELPAEPVKTAFSEEQTSEEIGSDAMTMLMTADDVRLAIVQLSDLDHPEQIDRILTGIALLPDEVQRQELFSYLNRTIESLKRNTGQETRPTLAQADSALLTMTEEKTPVFQDIFQRIRAIDPKAIDRDEKVTHLLTSIYELPDPQQQELLNDLARQLQP